MCFFGYPAPQPKNKKTKRSTGTKRGTNSVSDLEAAYYAANEALNLGYQTTEEVAMYHHPYVNYSPYPYGVVYPRGDEPGYISRSQWTSHDETLKRTHGAAIENGRKIEEMKAFVSGRFTATQEAAGNIQGDIRSSREAIEKTHAAVKGVHDTLKETRDAINRNFGAHIDKQNGCAADISRVRTLLEDEVKKRDEGHRRQQNMQEAWNYYQWMKETEREAEKRSSRGNTRTRQTSRSNSWSSTSTSNTARRRRVSFEEPHASEKRQRKDRDLKRAVLECLNQVIGETRERGNGPEGNRESHSSHFHARGPATSPWVGHHNADAPGGWQYSYSAFPGQGEFYFDDSINAATGKRKPPRYQYNPFIHNKAQRGPYYY